MREERQMNEFSSSNKTRQKAGKQIAPLIEKIESEFTLVLSEARIIKDKANEMLRFQAEKLTLEKNIKQLRRDLHETNTHLASVKAESELSHSKQSSNYNTLKEEVHSLERTITRREDYFQAYDRKLNGVMDAVSKHQAYISDRMFVFEEKFKQLSRETLEATKDIKRDFDSTISSTLALKNQLTNRIRHTEEKEKILDLYMSQREEIPRKLHQIYDDLRNCLKQNEFEEFRSWHEKAVQQSLSKARSMLEKALPPQTQEALKGLQGRFGELEAMKSQLRGIEEVRAEVEMMSMKIDQLERKEDHQLAQFREETEEIEEKIIEVIDKKIETIEEEIEHYNIQNEQSVDQKLQKMKEYLISFINESRPKSEKILPQESTPLQTPPNPEQTAFISAELSVARRERELAENHSLEIKNLAEGLNNKLNLFSNRITMCRSDIEIFTEGAVRQMKKIGDIRKEEESHMEQVGVLLADVMESLLILTSLALHEEPAPSEPKSFVTFHDGIILELDKQPTASVNYRRLQASSSELKESLLFALISQIDVLSAGHSIFKWDQYRPSAFFSKIKDNLILKSKKANRSPSAHAVSPRRRGKKQEGDEDLLFDLKMESEELMKGTAQKPRIAVNNSTLLLTSEKPKSQVHIRYKLKKQEERVRKEENERACFTASRSHRKTKISFN